jgi:hypothetical protein
LHIDSHYYISRVLIPPLERIFNLVGADVRSWYDEMPKAFKVDNLDPATISPTKNTTDPLDRFKIDEHFQGSVGESISSWAGRYSDILAQACARIVCTRQPALLPFSIAFSRVKIVYEVCRQYAHLALVYLQHSQSTASRWIAPGFTKDVGQRPMDHFLMRLQS